MRQPRPNLFVIGAMKSGTTSLHNYLNDHPDIFMSQIKEPSYFIDVSRSPRRPPGSIVLSEADYLTLFESARECPVIGESSTSYAKIPGYYCDLSKIAKSISDPRFIYIIRDPVKRTISHYWCAVSLYSERRGMFEAVQEEPHYRNVSHYAMQLERYFEAFGRERVLTLTSEEMISDPIQTMRSVYDWLGVDPSHRPSNAMIWYRQTPPVIRQDRGLPGIAALRGSRIWRTAGPHTPAWFRALTGSLSRKEVSVQSVDTDATVRYLRSPQQEETKKLSQLLDRDFPEWTTLYGGAI